MEGKLETAPHPARFPRRYRLGSNRNYRYVYRRGKSYPSKNLVLVYLRGRELKIGFSVSGKVGNAVTRNRIRRILREDARQLRAEEGREVYLRRPSVCQRCQTRTARPGDAIRALSCEAAERGRGAVGFPGWFARAGALQRPAPRREES